VGKDFDWDISEVYLDMMVYNFNYAIETNRDKVYMGYDDETLIDYFVYRKDWKVTIDILLEGAVEIEAYEYAAQLKNIKDKL